jgi:hypothetical protein
MKACSILALLALVALGGCTISGDDDDDDVTDGSDGGDDDPGDDDPGDDDPGDDDPGDDDPGDDDPGDGSAVEPRTGVWDYTEYEPNTNDCGLPASYGNGGGGFGLVNNGDDGFTVVPNDGTDSFDCIVDGADFDCPERATEEETVDPQYDATLIGQAEASGTFSDPENGSGTQTAVVECEGSDCALVELATGVDFPCTFSIDFVIEWRSGT